MSTRMRKKPRIRAFNPKSFDITIRGSCVISSRGITVISLIPNLTFMRFCNWR
jgi:hypothetical protein